MTPFRTRAFALALAAVTCCGIQPVEETTVRTERLGLGASTADVVTDVLVAGADVVAGKTADDLDPTAPLFSGKEMTFHAGVAFLSVAFITGAIVAFLFWRQGLGVVAAILIYLISGSTMTSTVLFIYTKGFKFPAFVTATHFLFNGSIAFAVMLLSPSQLGTKFVVPTRHEFLSMILPIATFTCFTYTLNNTALTYSTVTFNHLVATTTPLVSIIVLKLMGLPFDSRLFGPVCIVVLGCALTSFGDLKWSIMGLVFGLFANMARASKAVSQQVVLTGPARDKFNPVSILAWVCVPSFVLMLACTVTAHGVAPLVALRDHADRGWLVFAILYSCVNALILDTAGLFVVKQLGAVGSEVVGSAMCGLTILSGIALFHDAFSLVDCFGFAVVLLGLFLYSRKERSLKELSLTTLEQERVKGLVAAKTGNTNFEENSMAKSSTERQVTSGY